MLRIQPLSWHTLSLLLRLLPLALLPLALLLLLLLPLLLLQQRPSCRHCPARAPAPRPRR